MAQHNIYSQKGFTLIEMSIVLIVIGLILGAVVKGNDILQSAKQKKFYTTFVRQWEQSVISYYDRTGRLLGDGTANGGIDGEENGIFDDFPGSSAAAINNALKKVGLTPPPVMNNCSNNMQYAYTGPSGSHKIYMYLSRIYSHSEKKSKNALYFIHMPTDLAIAMDTMVDGQTSPGTGIWRRHTDDKSWPDASTTPTVWASYAINLP